MENIAVMLAYLDTPKQKSPALAVVLCLVFGPFGLLYVSTKEALIAIAVQFVVAILLFMFVPPLLIGAAFGAVWSVAGYKIAISHNEDVAQQKRVLMRRLQS